MSDQQDMRRLGGLINFLPFTYTIILIGSLSLIAVTFLSGNYSKDLLIELGYGSYTMTFYSFRLISMTFLTTPNASKSDYENTHEQDMITVIPLVLLALLSIFFGYVAKDSFVGIGSDMLSSSLFVHPSNVVLVEAEFSIPVFYKFLPLIVTLLDKGLKLGLVTAKVLDRGAVELLGPFGLSRSLSNGSQQIARLDTGVVTQYALYIMIGLISISLLFNIGDLVPLILIYIVGLLFISRPSLY
ncbi:BZ3500_MvSof-1268-A1-R1_C041g00088 [Microbotryum saponariae]|uniref:BZ3500_MvSof-1268-A1-R1_C041g00088 protein n=1 Tax=Microbotryum saponariae TaxID=289078 RepID=A0A2X0KNP1_9BASI|nr:BZ3500_MvSof-1268-A1-R1_C042g00099 [Microbotryum saponariae]SCZ95437.1 BZ3500_MvSof-1268-A1-R1_C041g00088 [Microbotryum saponariae]